MTSIVHPDDTLPDHLIPLQGEQWAVWRCAALRAAGFPAAMALELASPEGAAAADRLLAAETEYERSHRGAIQVVRAALDDLKQQPEGWDDDARRQPLLKALRRLIKGKLPRPDPALADMPELAGLAAAQRQVEAARTAFAEAHLQALAQQAERLHEIARDQRFQEAVLWQNRRAFHTAMRKVADTPPAAAGRAAQRRRHEAMVASYLQRYTTKNDTIGFFGPVGWASFAEDDEAVTARPGPELLAQRNVYLESWGVEQLARTLDRIKQVRPWLRPQRLPYARLEGTMLHLPLAAPMRLPAAAAAVLAACSGRHNARDLARLLIADPRAGVASEQEVMAMLQQLLDLKAIDWSFRIPVRPGAERVLAERFRDIGDERVRKLCSGALAKLERARRRIADSAGDVAELDAALGHLDDVFTRITRSAATRNAGEAYAGRTLVYEDCRRDLEVRLGSRVRDAIGEPLSLLLTSLRWCTVEVARSFRQLAREVHRELSQGRDEPVEVVPFWMRILPSIEELGGPHVDPVVGELQRRWIEILDIDPEQRRVERTSAELRSRIAAAFAVPAPGWQQAIYHSPDLLIAAPSLDAISRGEYQVVVGEVHVASNTLGSWVFRNQHPDPERFEADIARDLCEPGIHISSGKETIGPSRAFLLPPPASFHILPPPDHVADIPEPQRLAAEDLVVVDTGESVELRSRDGRLRFDIAEAMGRSLSSNVSHVFDLSADRPHWPRVTIDRLVISRETWTFESRQLTFAAAEDPAQRFLGARRWARAHGIPRFFFVGLPSERKPFYVDLDTPQYVDHLAKLLRRLPESDTPERTVKVAEMLPTPHQAWVPDAEGRRFLSELRMLVVDRTRHRRGAGASPDQPGDKGS